MIKEDPVVENGGFLFLKLPSSRTAAFGLVQLPSFTTPAFELIQKPSLGTAAIARFKPVGLGLYFFTFPLRSHSSRRSDDPAAAPSPALILFSSDFSDPLRFLH